MPLESLEIKFELMRKAGTLTKAAELMSDDEYQFNGDQLSKVIRGERGMRIVRVRVAKFLGKKVEEIFGN